MRYEIRFRINPTYKDFLDALGKGTDWRSIAYEFTSDLNMQSIANQVVEALAKKLKNLEKSRGYYESHEVKK